MPTLTRRRPRTCVACRLEFSKQTLIRIVRSPDGRAVVDETGKLPGRGAYLCPKPECLRKARKSGALSRALRVTIPDPCWEDLERCLRHHDEIKEKDEGREIRP